MESAGSTKKGVPMTTTHYTAPLGAVTILRVVDMFYSLRMTVKSLRDARTTRIALSRLSEHQLRDIGLTRGYVDSL